MDKLLSILHLIFVKPFYFIMWLGLLVIRIIFKAPLFLLFWGMSFTITIWIYGQIVALITTHRFLILSYFDISKYPVTVQDVFNAKFTFSATCNWYILPVVLLGLIEFVLFFKIMFLEKTENRGG